MSQGWGNPDADPLGDILAFKRAAAANWSVNFGIAVADSNEAIRTVREAFERLEGPDMSSTPDAAS